MHGGQYKVIFSLYASGFTIYYAYAIEYLGSQPDDSTSFNVNSSLNEFQGGVLTASQSLKDSIVRQYTWDYRLHKVTILTGETAKSKKEIIDAIKYKNTAQF